MKSYRSRIIIMPGVFGGSRYHHCEPFDHFLLVILNYFSPSSWFRAGSYHVCITPVRRVEVPWVASPWSLLTCQPANSPIYLSIHCKLWQRSGLLDTPERASLRRHIYGELLKRRNTCAKFNDHLINPVYAITSMHFYWSGYLSLHSKYYKEK